MFGGGDGIGDDAGADVEMDLAICDDGGADDNAELGFAIEPEIAESAGVRSTRDGFEFIDDFHGAEFGRAGDAAAGEAGAEGVEVGDAGTKAAFDGGDEVLDVGKSFEADEIGHLDGTEFADAAEVVAEEVSDHDQFGDFLGAGLEFVAELGVAGGIGMAGASALDGAGLNLRAAHAEK